MSPIAKIYWRTVKRGTRAYSSIPDELKADVKALAAQDVSDGAIFAEEYDRLIGEACYEENQSE